MFTAEHAAGVAALIAFGAWVLAELTTVRTGPWWMGQLGLMVFGLLAVGLLFVGLARRRSVTDR